MNAFWNALIHEIAHEIPDAPTFARFTVRLTVAALLSAIIGWNRQRGHKTAGLRTHMLVALGSALFVVSLVGEGTDAAAVSRAVQGIASGIGFIGAGAILKLESRNKIRGLTTASSLWMVAAIGAVAGLGKLGAALVGLALAWIVLDVLEKWEQPHPPEGARKSEFESDDGDL